MANRSNKSQVEKAGEKNADNAARATESANGSNESQVEKAGEKKAGPLRYVVLKGFIDKNTKADLDPGDIVELEPERASEINEKIPDAVAELAS